MKYFIIAGEASGDLHGSNLIYELRSLDNGAQIRCWGGDKMEAAGGVLDEHYRNTAFMGFAEVIKNIFTIRKLFIKCKKNITSFDPDIIVFIDYPGFNLRMLPWAKKKGFRCAYYITPQVWAWHLSRIHVLGKYADQMISILPFEPDFFKKYGYVSHYAGHPLLDAIHKFIPNQAITEKYNNTSKPVIALLPGSRSQEIRAILPVMLASLDFDANTVIIAATGSVDKGIYEECLNAKPEYQKASLEFNQTYSVLSVADIALVGSGTATLETALFNVPQIVCYKGNPFSYAIAKKLVNIPFISLVNLIAGKKIVTELIQNELTVERLQSEIKILFTNRQNMLDAYKELHMILGKEGGASRRAAALIMEACGHR